MWAEALGEAQEEDSGDREAEAGVAGVCQVATAVPPGETLLTLLWRDAVTGLQSLHVWGVATATEDAPACCLSASWPTREVKLGPTCERLFAWHGRSCMARKPG